VETPQEGAAEVPEDRVEEKEEHVVQEEEVELGVELVEGLPHESARQNRVTEGKEWFVGVTLFAEMGCLQCIGDR